MSHLYIVPDWFFGFDVTMELIFGIITLAVAVMASRIYKISKENSMKNFSVGFFFISISYLVWAAINLFIVSRTEGGLLELEFEKIAIIGFIAIYSQIILFILGLATIVYATLASKKPRLYYLIAGLSLLVVASSLNKLVSFRILSVFLLTYLTYHFFTEWQHHKNKNLVLMFIAFTLLLISNLNFIFSTSYYQAYVIGHILELCAYLLIFRNLIKTSFKKNIP